MGFAKKFLKFTVGTATGAAVGAGVATLLAPQRGEALQQDINNLVGEVKTSGQLAQVQTERELAERFRQRVNDPDVLKNAAGQSS